MIEGAAVTDGRRVIDGHFINDNLGGACAFDDIVWYGCTQIRCPGLEGQFQSRR